jgi:hypothetical protein
LPIDLPDSKENEMSLKGSTATVPIGRAEAQTLTANDVGNFLNGFAAAIELDQIRVDALPSDAFHPEYDADMWYRWRRCHLDFISQLLSTVDAIPATMLQELSQLAATCNPAIVRGVLIDLFADGASGSCAEEQFKTAALFFGWLIKELRNWSDSRQDAARTQVMHWLSMTDPLNIARDPECGYRQPTGFVS